MPKPNAKPRTNSSSSSSSFFVDQIIRVGRGDGSWRVWKVVGVFLGGEAQEDVVELMTLDLKPSGEGRLCVPRDLLSAIAFRAQSQS